MIRSRRKKKKEKEKEKGEIMKELKKKNGSSQSSQMML